MKEKNRFFIITVDTEGDNLWKIRNSVKSMSRIKNENGRYIERFQLLCEKYKFIPTYLTNYEMALSDPFQKMVKEHSGEGKLEIGMHLHAFNSPPVYELGDRRGGNKAYAGEYPEQVLKQKVDYLTKLLEDTFRMPVKSHRGGRWYLDEQYLKLLVQYGYKVDCTVTPGIDWRINHGQTEDSKGINYRRFPHKPYELSLKDISRKGKSGIIEVPVTIGNKDITYILKNPDRLFCHQAKIWMRPDGKNLADMKRLADKKQYVYKIDYVEFMIHSSELMPGGSPVFQNEKQIEKLYLDMEELFAYLSGSYTGISLSAYANKVMSCKQRKSRWLHE